MNSENAQFITGLAVGLALISSTSGQRNNRGFSPSFSLAPRRNNFDSFYSQPFSSFGGNDDSIENFLMGFLKGLKGALGGQNRFWKPTWGGFGDWGSGFNNWFGGRRGDKLRQLFLGSLLNAFLGKLFGGRGGFSY